MITSKLATAITIFKKYLLLGKEAIKEYKKGGIDRLFFSLRRHWKKRKGKLLVSYPISSDYTLGLISVVILNDGNFEFIGPCLKSIEENLDAKYKVEIIIGEMRSKKRGTWKFYRKLKQRYRNIKIKKITKRFSLKKYDYLVNMFAKGQYLIFINSCFVVDDDWINNLIEPLKNKKIAIIEKEFIYKQNPKNTKCIAMRHDIFDRFKLTDDLLESISNKKYLALKNSGFDTVIYKHDNKYKKNNNTIVVIRDDGIGDLLMAVSAFNNLRKKYPNKKLILLTYERNMEMMEGFKIFDEILPIPNNQKYAPLPIPGPKSQVFNLIDMEMKFGHSFAKAKNSNKINRHLVMTEKLNVDKKFEIVPMPEYPKAKKQLLKTLAEMEIELEQDFVVLNLIASNPARSWWEPYYPKLIKAIEDLGFIPLVVGTKDSPYFQGEKLVNLVGKTKTITEYIEAIKLGKYVISTDTSAYHVAALADIPFLAIFTGGVLPEARLQNYSKYEVIAPPKTLSCYPCWDEGCKDLSIRHKKDPCRLIIKPEEVIEKFKQLINK